MKTCIKCGQEVPEDSISAGFGIFMCPKCFPDQTTVFIVPDYWQKHDENANKVIARLWAKSAFGDSPC